MRFVECLRCHKLSLPGGRECPHCKASFPKNCRNHKISAPDPDDLVHLSISCAGCGRRLKLGTEKCPECGAFIWREYAARSVAMNATVSQAYVKAQRIESFKPASLMALATSGLVVYVDLFLLIPFRWFLLSPLAMSLGSLLTIGRWFHRFGSYESNDEEFATARRTVKGALWRWLAVLVVQVSIVTFWLLR